MSDFRAILLVLAATLAFAVQDMIVKVTAASVSIWQMQSVRSVAVLVLLAALLAVLGRLGEIWPRRWRWPLIRAAFMTGSYLFFYAALPYLSLAKAASVFFVSPILITLFAALLLGEPIGPRRVAAVVAGFAGVLLIVQPGLAGWTPVALMPILAAACYALGVVLTRWRCRDDPGFSLTMVSSLAFAAVGIAGLIVVPLLPLPEAVRASHGFVTSGWLPLTPLLLALLVATAVTHILGMLSSVRAYQTGEASRLAPFEYAYLVIVGVFELAFWGTVPDGPTLAGMTLICGAGGFVAWREGRPVRPRMQQNAEIPWTPDHAADPAAPGAGGEGPAAGDPR